MAWLDQHNGAVVAVATVLNVLVAAVYAFVTWRLWKVAREQAATTHQLQAGRKKNPSLETLKRLARALGVPLTELLE